jgi:hypothetical protein
VARGRQLWAAVLGDAGLRGLLRTALALVVAWLILDFSAADLREALRLDPVPLTCRDWLSRPSQARWVALSGCRLDLQQAASRNYRGFLPMVDGGRAPVKFLELFLPLSGQDQRELPLRAVVATSDPALLASLEELAQLPVGQVNAFLDAHRLELEAHLTPARLVGYVDPVPSWGARQALRSLEAPDALVLQEGREPTRANAFVGLVVGLGLVVSALWGPASRLRAAFRAD